MAFIKTPDGGFYLSDTQFEVDHQKNTVAIKTSEIPVGDYLPLVGGQMEADAVIAGTDTLEISVVNGGQSGVIGVSSSGTTISNETGDTPTSSVRVIQESVEISTDGTTVTFNGTGVNFGSSAISGVNSIGGNTEVAIESEIDMNNHKITSLADPVATSDAATKNYVDNTTLGYLKTSGGSVSGTISMNNNKITNLGAPSDANDAATKEYVDSAAGIGAATLSVAGIVRQAQNVNQFPEPSQVTAQQVADNFNNLVQNLINAGIMIAGE